MAPALRRVIPLLIGTMLAFAATGSAPALAAGASHGTPRLPASHQERMAGERSAPLHPGEELTPGQSLTSDTVTLTMQHDGNLVLYLNGFVGHPNFALWASGTSGDNTAIMQTDGNFVIYPSDEVGNRRLAEWATHTSGNNVLEVQDDGNVVIYASCCIGAPSAAKWATGTALWSA
jgi:hypothetical protein